MPHFKWHIIQHEVPFEINDTGILVTPLNGMYGPQTFGPECSYPGIVHHGRVFRSQAQVALPFSSKNTSSCADADEAIQPFVSFGFNIADKILYVSDTSSIPEDTWAYLESWSKGCAGSIPMFVCDCLNVRPHPAHLSLGEAVAIGRRFGATRTYLTGIDHDLSNEDLVRIGKDLEISGSLADSDFPVAIKETVADGSPIWVRPGFDGLRVFVSGCGEVKDEAYD